MFLWKRKNKRDASISAFSNYVIKKIVPRFLIRPSEILRDSEKQFRRGLSARTAERELMELARDTALVSALGLAKEVHEATGHEISDAEWGDLYIASVFAVLSSVRDRPRIIAAALEMLGSVISVDCRYLLFEPDETLNDICESGWDELHKYLVHDEAILPRAFAHCASKAIKMRRLGIATPYSDFDPYIGPDAIVLSTIDLALSEKNSVLIRAWADTVTQVGDIADELDVEMWKS